MFPLLILSIVILIFILNYKRILEAIRIYKFAGTLPGPKALPLIGNILLFAVPQKDILSAFNEDYKKHDSPKRYWLGLNLYAAFDKPEHIEAIMTNPAASYKGDVYHVIADSIGYGLIQSSGPKHKLHRKLIQMPLRRKILDKYLHVFNERAIECVQNLETHVDKDYFDAIHIMEKSAMALVTEIIMGIKTFLNDRENEELLKHLETIYRTGAERVYKIWLHPKWIHRFSENYKNLSEALEYFNNYIERAIMYKKKELKKLPSECKLEDLEVPLDLLILAKDDYGQNIFSDAEIKEEVITLYTAAEDTASTIASFLLLMLAIHPDVQEKVWMEQAQIFGDECSLIEINVEDLDRMKYLHMVLQEVLRLYPIGPNITRKNTEDLKIGEYVVPKNVNILMNIFHMQRSEKLWKDPEKFDPMRFTPEEKSKRHPYSYAPFSGGNRSCIGKDFAQMAIKCFASYIVRSYTLHTDWTMKDIKVEGDISVRSSDGYKIKIKKRQPQ